MHFSSYLLLTVAVFSILQSTLAVVIFVYPDSTCNTTCDGSLQKPYPTIKTGVSALPAVSSSLVLLPGIYKGSGNVDVKINWRSLPIYGKSYESTIIDCEGAGVKALDLAGGFFTLHGFTVRNCGSNETGAVTLIYGDLVLSAMKFDSNFGPFGGAVSVSYGTISSAGTTVNIFTNNDADINGGAMWQTYAGITVNGYEVFEGNSVAGNVNAPDANIYGDNVTALRYPPAGSPPPHCMGPQTVYPVTYVDPTVNCSAVNCTGDEDKPFGNIAAVFTGGPAQFGGKIALKPGTYTGPLNRELQVHNVNLQFIRWPDTTGDVVIDCQNQGFGFAFYDGHFAMSDITITNCVTDHPAGGGAMNFTRGVLQLTNIHFVDNSATAGPGGAIAASEGEVFVYGGSFSGNSAAAGGGAMNVVGAGMLIYNHTTFNDNTRDISGIIGDTLCSDKSFIGTDGTPSFDPRNEDDGNCTIRLTSPSTVAVFPGSLDTTLYPQDSQGNTQPNGWGGIEFDSLVELDDSNSPLEATRIDRLSMSWTQTATLNESSVSHIVYDAFGPSYQFLRVIHDFVHTNTTVAFGPKQIFLREGTIKTSVELALWDFRSSYHSLALTLRTRSASGVNHVQSTLLADNETTLYTITTDDVIMYFQVLPFALHELGQVVKPVGITTWRQGGAQYFQFAFAAFDTFLSYDPDMSVVINPDDGGDGVDEGLIIGLTVGLVLGAALLVIVVGVLGTTATVLIRRWRRHTLEHRLTLVEITESNQAN